MIHTVKTMRDISDILQSLLKLFSMFKTSIWYDKDNDKYNFPYDLRIKCINCYKVFG